MRKIIKHTEIGILLMNHEEVIFGYMKAASVFFYRYGRIRGF